MGVDRSKFAIALRMRCKSDDFASDAAALWTEGCAHLSGSPSQPPAGYSDRERGANRVQGLRIGDPELMAFRAVKDEKDWLAMTEVALWRRGADDVVATLLRWRESRGGHVSDAKAVEPESWKALRQRAVSLDDGPIASFAELRSAVLGTGGSHAPADSTNDRLMADLDYYKALAVEQGIALRRLRGQISASMSRESDAPVSAQAPEIEPLKDLKDIASWVLQFDGELVVLPRALQETRKSVYAEPETLGQALALLAGPYRRMRLGEVPREEFQKALDAAGLKINGSGGEVTLTADPYNVMWHGKRQTLAMHMAKGNSRDIRHCLRCYFFWDDELGVPVVGWCPTHLDNTRT
jgi:hypothetical protein